MIADGESIRSVRSSSDPSDPSQVDVTSAPLISVPTQVERQVVVIDSSGVLHPFHVHKMDSGPVRLITIAHAFNYRVAVLRDGVRSAVRVGRSRKAENMFPDGCEYFMGTTGDGNVSDCFNFDGGGTRIRLENERITGRATTGTVDK